MRGGRHRPEASSRATASRSSSPRCSGTASSTPTCTPATSWSATPGADFNRYIALDFGIVGTLSDFDKNYLAQNFLAFFRRDYRRVAELHVESGWVPATTRVEELEGAVRACCEPFFDRPLKEISLGLVLLRLFQASRRFNVEIQPQLVLLQKTLLNIEGLGRQLDPDLDLWVTAKPILERWMQEQIGVVGFNERMRHEATHWGRLLPRVAAAGARGADPRGPPADRPGDPRAAREGGCRTASHATLDPLLRAAADRLCWRSRRVASSAGERPRRAAAARPLPSPPVRLLLRPPRPDRADHADLPRAGLSRRDRRHRPVRRPARQERQGLPGRRPQPAAVHEHGHRVRHLVRRRDGAGGVVDLPAATGCTAWSPIRSARRSA